MFMKPQPAQDNPTGEIGNLDLSLLLEAGLPPAGVPVSPSAWPPPPEALAGVLPGYEITALLGRGGMSAVYKGIQTSLERDVAIKLLSPELSADPEFEVRFHREAKAMARLNHPHIVQIYDYGRTEAGQHYIVMEYVDGSDLHQIVRSGQLDAERTLKAVTQVCDALQYAHSLGFIHRDIKPGNILLNRQGVLKVGDFGLAKLLSESAPEAQAQADDGQRLTRSGAAMGTPHYAAPEQLDGQGDVDHRADLYSLGVMFYEMLTREMPRGAPKLPSRKIASLDARLDGVVFKAMAADPDERYQTAIDLRTDVDQIRANLPPQSPAAPVVTREKSAAATHRPTAARLRVGLTALLILGGLAFFFEPWKSGGKPTTESHAITPEPPFHEVAPPDEKPSEPPPAAPLLSLSLPSEVSGSVVARPLSPTGVLPKRGVGAIPETVSRLTNVAMISTGSTHAMALTTEGRLYRWGMLPTTFFLKTFSAQVPMKMSGEGKRVVQMIAGRPDAVLLEDGTVLIQRDGNGAVTVLNPRAPVARIGGTPPFLWGLNAQGIITYLGPNPAQLKQTKIPEDLDKIPLREIKGSWHNAIAFTRDGDVLPWAFDDPRHNQIDPALKATFKDDPVVDSLLSLGGHYYSFVQQSGRFHMFGEGSANFRQPPVSITGFTRGMALLVDYNWQGICYSQQTEEGITWSVIEAYPSDNKSRLDYLDGLLREARPLAIATPTIYDQHDVELTILMLVDPASPVRKVEAGN